MSRQARFTQEKQCQACGRSFWAARSDARTCGPTCKKRLQRGSIYSIDKKQPHPGQNGSRRRIISAGHVPFIAAVNLDHPLCQAWPQGQLVRFLHGPGGWKPGRINWHSESGQACLRSARGCTRPSDVNDTWQLPVEDLTGCVAVFTWDVRRA